MKNNKSRRGQRKLTKGKKEKTSFKDISPFWMWKIEKKGKDFLEGKYCCLFFIFHIFCYHIFFFYFAFFFLPPPLSFPRAASCFPRIPNVDIFFPSYKIFPPSKNFFLQQLFFYYSFLFFHSTFFILFLSFLLFFFYSLCCNLLLSLKR